MQNAVVTDADLIVQKLRDRSVPCVSYVKILEQRVAELDQKAFRTEMQRFLPTRIVDATVDQSSYWDAVRNTVHDEVQKIVRTLA